VPTVSITVALNTQIMNGPTTGLSDITLLIDEPAVLNNAAINKQTPDPVFSQTGDGIDYKNGEAPNIFRGVISGNSVTFVGVPLDPPGGGAGAPTRILRITNIRANVTLLGVGGTGVPAQVTAFVSSSGPNPLPINNATQIVGFVQQGSRFELRTNTGVVPPSSPATAAFTFSAFQPVNPNLLADPSFRGALMSFFVQFNEQFSTSYRMQRQPGGFAGLGAVRIDETGFDNVGTGAIPLLPNGPSMPQLGLATNGTRFRIVIDGIPQNVSVFVTVRNIPLPPDPQLSGPNIPPARALLVNGADFNGVGGTVSPPILPGKVAESGGFQIVPLAINPNRFAMAVWESVNPDPSLLDSVRFGIVLASTLATNLSGPATATVGGDLAPINPNSIPPPGPPFPQFSSFVITTLPGFTMTVTQIIG
jgi:hypothetical protein